MPGAFAGLPEELRAGFAAVAPGAALAFHAFVPSGILAREILDGADADVYVSANIRFMADLWRAGLVPEPRVLAGNRLCIIVRPDRASQIHRLEDLTRNDVRLVTPQSATDPCGQYVVELFERAGLTDAMRAKEEAASLLHSIGSGDLPAFVSDDRADAGIVYASEA
jgi:molybdate transport system substrate-binding protein